MELITLRAIESLLLPPGNVLVLMLIGLLWGSGRSVALLFLFLSTSALYLQSLPTVAMGIAARLETTRALNHEVLTRHAADVIVVLGAGRYSDAAEYGTDELSSFSLERLQYGVFLRRRTGLPIVLTGGRPYDERESEARIMQRVLAREFGITDRVWTEEHSRNTAENARLTARLLADQGLRRVVLVTHALHMPRAVAVFRQAGLDVIPAPTRYLSQTFANQPMVLRWLPSAAALHLTRLTLHELIGRQWYRIRYGENADSGPQITDPINPAG